MTPDRPLMFKDVLATLQQRFDLERVGGQTRIYTIGNKLGVVYLIHGTLHGVGLSWQRGSKTIEAIYYWNSFNVDHAPDLMIDIPSGATTAIIPRIVDFVANPHTGILHEADLPDSEDRIMARKPSGDRFIIPGSAAMEKKVDSMMAQAADQNATPSMEEQYEQLREKIELVAGNRSHHIKSLLIYGMPSSGKTHSVIQTIKAMGLKEGTDYVIKKGSITDFAAYRAMIMNIDSLLIFDDCDSVVATKVGKNMIKGALDTYLVRDLSYDNANAIDTDSMPTEDRIAFVDAMSRVMRGTASRDDLKHFERYAVDDKKKKTDNGPEDTYNKVFVNADGEFEIPDPTTMLAHLDGGSFNDRLHALQDYFQRRLPNKIDYRGRMIFISNMGEDEWDSAILTRTFRQYMAFPDGEMLDFLDKIKGSIDAPNLSNDQKQEVIDYIRVLHEKGSLKSPINFRLIQQAFDLRLTSEWKKALMSL